MLLLFKVNTKEITDECMRLRARQTSFVVVVDASLLSIPLEYGTRQHTQHATSFITARLDGLSVDAFS